MKSFLHLVLYTPMYNGLVLVTNIIPGGNIGVSVVVFTLIVRLLLFPISKKSVETQIKMKILQPQMNDLKEKYKDKQDVYAKELMSFYKENKLNPFSSVLFMLIQIPIIITLYYVFYRSNLPVIDNNILYSFVHAPDFVSMHFLGFDISQTKNYLFAFLAGLTTFFQTYLSMPPTPEKKDKPSFGDDLARSMSVQMKFILPIMIFFIASRLSGVIALYWITSNMFTIGQELYMRKIGLKGKNGQTIS